MVLPGVVCVCMLVFSWSSQHNVQDDWENVTGLKLGSLGKVRQLHVSNGHIVFFVRGEEDGDPVSFLV